MNSSMDLHNAVTIGDNEYHALTLKTDCKQESSGGNFTPVIKFVNKSGQPLPLDGVNDSLNYSNFT